MRLYFHQGKLQFMSNTIRIPYHFGGAMPVTLRNLAYFVALAEERHFGRAAGRVHVSQPALSMQLRELEDSLGVALVERLGRDMRLTSAGREVELRARRVLAEVAALEQSARHQAVAGRINLGAIPTLAPYLLPATLPLLRAAHVTRELRLREAQTEVLLAGLERGQLDAVVIAEPQDRSGLVLTPLFEDRFLLAGHAARLDRLPETESLRPVALDPDQLLLLDEGHCLADQALEVCGLNRRQTRLDLGASSLSTLCGLVGQGMGLTLLPEVALRQEQAATPGLTARRFATPEPARRIVMARLAGLSESGWVADLAQALRQAGEDLVRHARNSLPVVA